MKEINIDDLFGGKLIESLFEFKLYDFIRYHFSKDDFKKNCKLFTISDFIIRLDVNNKSTYFLYDYKTKEIFSFDKL